MQGNELPNLSLARYPLVLLPVGLLGALTALAATRAVRGRSSLGLLVLGFGAAALAGASVYLGRNGPRDAGAAAPLARPTPRDRFTREPRRASAFTEKVERAVRRPDRFPTISPPPKPGATRPS